MGVKTIGNRAFRWLSLSLLVVLVDQFSKNWILQYLTYPHERVWLPILNVVLRYNPGAAFSFLSDEGGWQVWFFLLVAVTIITILFFWMRRRPENDRLSAVGVSLVIGGAVGNVIDRVRYGYVIDFIDFHWSTWHFATFNLADSAITVGAGCLLLRLLMKEPRLKN